MVFIGQQHHLLYYFPHLGPTFLRSIPNYIFPVPTGKHSINLLVNKIFPLILKIAILCLGYAEL